MTTVQVSGSYGAFLCARVCVFVLQRYRFEVFYVFFYLHTYEKRRREFRRSDTHNKHTRTGIWTGLAGIFSGCFLNSCWYRGLVGLIHSPPVVDFFFTRWGQLPFSCFM